MSTAKRGFSRSGGRGGGPTLHPISPAHTSCLACCPSHPIPHLQYTYCSSSSLLVPQNLFHLYARLISSSPPSPPSEIPPLPPPKSDSFPEVRAGGFEGEGGVATLSLSLSIPKADSSVFRCRIRDWDQDEIGSDPIATTCEE